MRELERRALAVKATQKAYEARAFDWQHSCMHMVKFHAKQLGHNMPSIPRFNGPLGARKSMKAMGFDSLEQVMDKFFDRINPAHMLIGDVMMCDSPDGLGGLLIRADIRKYLGYYDDAGCVIIDPGMKPATGAWRL